MNSWLQGSRNGCRLTVHVTPRASVTETAGTHGDALKIRLRAPPVDGKANEVLVAFLADRLGIPRGAIRIVSGLASRSKQLEIIGLSDTAVAARLGSEPSSR